MNKSVLATKLFQEVSKGLKAINLKECVLVKIENDEGCTSVLCRGIELVGGKFNPLQLFKALGYRVIEWFDEDKPDYVKYIFDTFGDKESYFIILNDYGFVRKVCYGLTDSVDFGNVGRGFKFTAKPCDNLSDYMVSQLEQYCKRARLEVTFNR